MPASPRLSSCASDLQCPTPYLPSQPCDLCQGVLSTFSPCAEGLDVQRVPSWCAAFSSYSVLLSHGCAAVTKDRQERRRNLRHKTASFLCFLPVGAWQHKVLLFSEVGVGPLHPHPPVMLMSEDVEVWRSR